MTDVLFDPTRNRTLHQHMSHESKFKGSVGLTNTGAGVAVRARNEGYPKVRSYKTLCKATHLSLMTFVLVSQFTVNNYLA